MVQESKVYQLVFWIHLLVCSCSESMSVEVILVLPFPISGGFSVFHVFCQLDQCKKCYASWHLLYKNNIFFWQWKLDKLDKQTWPCSETHLTDIGANQLNVNMQVWIYNVPQFSFRKLRWHKSRGRDAHRGVMVWQSNQRSRWKTSAGSTTNTS